MLEVIAAKHRELGRGKAVFKKAVQVLASQAPVSTNIFEKNSYFKTPHLVASQIPCASAPQGPRQFINQSCGQKHRHTSNTSSLVLYKCLRADDEFHARCRPL